MPIGIVILAYLQKPTFLGPLAINKKLKGLKKMVFINSVMLMFDLPM